MEYSLKERVVIIVGPFTSTIQNLISGLTSEGADVAYLASNASVAEKFCQQLNGIREVKPKQGRAMAMSIQLSDVNSIRDVVGKVAQTFGGVDVLIDSLLNEKPTPFNIEDKDFNLDEIINHNLKASLMLTQSVAGFLKGRKKGRIIYLNYQPVLSGQESDLLQTAIRSGLVNFATGLAAQLKPFNVTVNSISLGYTEEYLQSRSSQGSIKEALESFKAVDPKARIVEPEKITQALIFLIGNSGLAISGQNIQVS